MDSGTWVKCTICDGHVSQVLFLAQRGINGNDKALGMMGMDKVGCLFQVQSMDPDDGECIFLEERQFR